MASMGKKGKKKNVKIKPENVVNQSKQDSCRNKVNLYNYFNSEEISEIKSTLKVKDVSCAPFVIGAVIINKLDLLKKIVKQGCNINETGPNNTTALIWAVKIKNLEMIEYLISKGADPTIKTDNGDNVLVIALEHKSWDEESYINFWYTVKNVSFVDANFTSKNGHNLLHIAIRRDWEELIKILIEENVNVDIPNSNGVTPLMLACYKNNTHVVNMLLSVGVDILKEDNHNRMAFCYAISSDLKNAKPPFTLSQQILLHLQRRISIMDYVERRVEVVKLTSERTEFSTSTSEMMVNVIHYIIQYIPDGVKLLIEFNIFENLSEVLNSTTKNQDVQKFLLSVAYEMLFYNEQTLNFNSDVLKKLIQNFINSEIANICLVHLNNNFENNSLTALCFYILVFLCANNEIGQNWLKVHYHELYTIYNQYFDECFNNVQQIFSDDKRIKMVKRKLKKIKKIIQQNPVPIENVDISEIVQSTSKKLSKFETPCSNIVSNKKTKRRAKALKAKMTKIKAAELVGRLQGTVKKTPEVNSSVKVDHGFSNKEIVVDTVGLNSHEMSENVSETIKSSQEQRFDKFSSNLAFDFNYHQYMAPPDNLNSIDKEENPIVYSLLQFLHNEVYASKKEALDEVDWISKIQRLPFDSVPFLYNGLDIDKVKLREANEYLKKMVDKECNIPQKDIVTNVNLIIDYLSELLELIILKYRRFWENDKKMINNCGLLDNKGDQKPIDGYLQYVSQVEKLEKTTIDDLKNNFIDLTNTIRHLALINLAECYSNLCFLESTLLKFKIRGRTFLYDICPCENVKILYKNTPEFFENGKVVLNYIEDSLNGKEKYPRSDIKVEVSGHFDANLYKEHKSDVPTELHSKKIPDKFAKHERNRYKYSEMKEKTLVDAYHLVNSMATVCDSEEDESVDMLTSAFLENSDDDLTTGESMENETSRAALARQIDIPIKYSELVLKVLTKHVESSSSLENIPSRWSARIQALQTLSENLQTSAGDVVIYKKADKYQEFIISQGGNFKPVMLGLNSSNQPLAVKRIPREHSVCKVMKNLITPLLGLRHKYILHYYVCDYEDNELVLATPLCEFNIGQYVLLLKETTNNNFFNLKPIDIVRQFLIGLKFLHVRKEPIVHGNLKPSNIFVDLNGIVKIAEFGTHKALYKTVEAPKSSLIWFSQETYKGYKLSSVMECTCASDIQVSGMLIYFILSGGVHPYGSDVVTILKNLEKSVLNLPHTKDVYIVDLVTWMMMCDPKKRANIEQVLSHIIFWSDEKKWKFFTKCAGLNYHRDLRVSSIDLEISDLHDTVDKVSVQEKISTNWIDEMRNKFLNLLISEEDTVSGLLRFIRYYYENQNKIDLREKELVSFILKHLPAFPLSLYRILEVTNWLRHPAFYEYTDTDSMLL